MQQFQFLGPLGLFPAVIPRDVGIKARRPRLKPSAMSSLQRDAAKNAFFLRRSAILPKLKTSATAMPSSVPSQISSTRTPSLADPNKVDREIAMADALADSLNERPGQNKGAVFFF